MGLVKKIKHFFLCTDHCVKLMFRAKNRDLIQKLQKSILYHVNSVLELNK